MCKSMEKSQLKKPWLIVCVGRDGEIRVEQLSTLENVSLGVILRMLGIELLSGLSGKRLIKLSMGQVEIVQRNLLIVSVEPQE